MLTSCISQTFNIRVIFFAFAKTHLLSNIYESLMLSVLCEAYICLPTNRHPLSVVGSPFAFSRSLMQSGMPVSHPGFLAAATAAAASKSLSARSASLNNLALS
jgi:hypothetical protein